MHVAGSPADARATHLGIQRDGARHAHIGVAVDVHVTVALEVPDDRHPRFLLHALDEAAAPARHDDIEIVAHAGEHVADRGTIAGRHQLYAAARQAGGGETVCQALVQRAARMLALGTATQDAGVAGFQAEHTGVRRDVGAALVDDADHSERHSDPLDA